ncbi:MAG: hypothetical protein JNM94_12190 [Phycisphaerae bacterium]|nr:hypothetical protein [Phycisphaerae bacterium]
MSGDRSPVEKAILGLLRRIPERWEEIDPDALTSAEADALYRMTEAGFVERRFRVRLARVDGPEWVETEVSATGECGLAEAMGPVIEATYPRWKDKFEASRRTTPNSNGGIHSTEVGKGKWRLTQYGVIARDDIGFCDDRILDFVFKRNGFQHRGVLQGSGTSHSCTLGGLGSFTEPVPAPVTVKNADEIAVAIRDAFAAGPATPLGTAAPQGAAPTEAPACVPSSADVVPSRALKEADLHVLQALCALPSDEVHTSARIAEALGHRLSAKTVDAAIRRLINYKLADRPLGPKSGARATTLGRMRNGSSSARHCDA